MDEMHKEMLDAALTGGKNDGRLLLAEIAGLLKEGHDENLTHGLLPKEFVLYLIKALSLLLDSPREVDINLKIAKPAHNPGEDINLTRDGIITYMCKKYNEQARTISPKAGMNNTYLDVALEISTNNNFQLLRDDKDEMSEKRIERIYRRTIQCFDTLINIEHFEWIYNNLKSGKYTESTHITLDTYKRLNLKFNEEIKNHEMVNVVEKELRNTDESLYKTITEKIQNIEGHKKPKQT